MLTLAVLALAVNTVHVPEDSKLTRQEFERIQPNIAVSVYEKTVVVGATDVLVIYVNEQSRIPADHVKAGSLAAAAKEARRIWIFIPSIEKYLGLTRTDPKFRIALGRVLAHELEHVLRDERGHDKKGWFSAHVDREWLLGLGEISK